MITYIYNYGKRSWFTFDRFCTQFYYSGISEHESEFSLRDKTDFQGLDRSFPVKSSSEQR